MEAIITTEGGLCMGLYWHKKISPSHMLDASRLSLQISSLDMQPPPTEQAPRIIFQMQTMLIYQ
jgi:hypothetical protein